MQSVESSPALAKSPGPESGIRIQGMESRDGERGDNADSAAASNQAWQVRLAGPVLAGAVPYEPDAGW